MRCSIFGISLLLISTSVFGQKVTGKSEIFGVVVDSVSRKPMRAATISLLSAKDSSYVDATVTDGDGRFLVRNVPQGNYRLLATFIGYRNASAPVSVNTLNAALDTISMVQQANVLDEMIVKEEAPPVRIRQDTIEFNANSFKTQPNAQVEALLRKLPGVEVARDGSVKANGQAVTQVLVDGKPFFGNDPKMATRNLPADIIDKVQLYEQSSDQSQFSGMDDGNRQNTINLTIKKDMGKGYFGQNSLGAGNGLNEGSERYQGRLSVNRFNNHDGGQTRQLSVVGQANNLNQQNFSMTGDNGEVQINGNAGPPGNQMPTNIIETKAGGINYRSDGAKPKWGKRAEIAASYFANQTITTTDQESRRINVLPDRSFVTDQYNYSKNKRTNQRFNGRFDWQLDSLTSIRITPNISWQNTDYKSIANSSSYLNNGDSLNSGNTVYDSDGNRMNGFNNLLLMRKLNKPGRTLSANLNTTLNNGKADSYNRSVISFSGSDSTNADVKRIDQQSFQNNYSLENMLSLSFTERISLNKKLEIRYAYGDARNRLGREVWEKQEKTGQYIHPNMLLSNRSGSGFATHKIGSALQTSRLKYSFSVGFDLQASMLSLKNRSVDSSSSRKYFHVLPNALLNFAIAGNQSIRLQYRSRLTPPSITQLQPVPDNSNPLNISIGNPRLDPTYLNNVVLTYNSSYNAGRESIFLSTTFNQSNNYITSATRVTENGAQLTQPVNAGGYWVSNSFLSLGKTIPAIQMSVTVSANSNLTQVNSLVNSQTNRSRVVSLGSGLGIQSTGDSKLDFGLTVRISYQTAKYSLLSKQNTAFWSPYATGDVNWQLPFNWVVASDVTYHATTGRTAAYNQQFVLWNVTFAKKFMKGKEGEVRWQIFDLLNQNRSLIRNTAETFIEDVQSKVLKRYFLISFVYNLRKFGI
ncbi:outer membrane beta-barrel protein [Dyadobacter chenwenxiniae]|uniref:Outer membrane beta-barrel protein n=1 Tax=Dyadobacter chenwenxiniae TaxID=2906456 RepID=A0A9X1PGX5_9BACT|nr:TonB-dependent receptor [Dyadobacter chenwenxiniae]MCF0060533.1 outer membrane beta-barrel protein [Dyadobacter chenwenxiniae]UON86264.1 outer membrane beta-barrel protein [Dyadobacter chenwenxiniae]